MNQLFPLTDWSLESMKQALTVIIRRIDKLFSKMHKTVKVIFPKFHILYVIHDNNKQTLKK